MTALVEDDGRRATPVVVVAQPGFNAWRSRQGALAQAWLRRTGFNAAAGELGWLPGDDGEPAQVVAGLGEAANIESLGSAARQLPPGDYRLAAGTAPAPARRLALGWGLGAYRFAAYRAPPKAAATLLVPPRDSAVLDELRAVCYCRDLINTPAADMLPAQLEAAARQLAAAHGAEFQAVTGPALLERGFNAIHAVGRASKDPPRLIDLRWGDQRHPKVTLVGKGVCFDSGGLDIKPASNMRLMKKDMGGAAHVLALAMLVLRRGLPVRLRVLVPAVENAIAGNAYHPGDVLRTYKGLTVEVENTDAEGRLVLADTIALAAEECPALLVDFATLTGAARTALGTDLPAMFATDDDIAAAVARHGAEVEDPVWRMPLFAPYRRMLDTEVADLRSAPTNPAYAGAIAAALFLERFTADVPWLHFDIMAWNLTTRPAHPIGGEAMGLRALNAYLQARFG